MKSPFFLAGVISAAVFASACDQTKLVADSTSGLFERAQPGLESYWDYETMGKAFPASIVQLEGILRIVPDNQVILQQGVAAYVGYGYGWIEDRIEEADATDDYEEADHLRRRAKMLYLRAKDLAEHLVDLKTLGGRAEATSGGLDEFEAWLDAQFVEKEQVMVLLWWGQAWAAYINLAMEDMEVVADVPLAKAILQHSVDLDPDSLYSAGRMALGILWSAQLPPDMDLSKKYFEEGLKATERRNLLLQMNMARFYAVNLGDHKLFTELLEEVVNAGDVLPEARLGNLIARRRAERYLRLIDTFFSDLSE